MSIIASILALLGLGSCADFRTVPVDGFEKAVSGTDVQLVDVRTPEEYAEGHIGGAVNIDVNAAGFTAKALEALTKEQPVAVYCRTGRRSAKAAGILARKGFDVINLDGGIHAWTSAGKPVIGEGLPYEIDSFTSDSGKQVRFSALVHASILIEYDGLSIYVDPVRKLGGREIDYSALPKADFVLVTHEHGDHFDKDLLAGMKGEVITNERCAGMLGYGSVMSNGDGMSVREDIHIDAVPAYNISEGRTQFHPKGRDNGYILSLDGLRIYIAGDTEDIPEMEGIKDIDIAFLPCNQPYTMTPEQLVNAARVINPKVVFPYHYGATDISGIPAALPGIDVRIRQYQ